MAYYGTIAILLSAGNSARMGTVLPKQYRLLRGAPLLRRSVQQLLLARSSFDKIIIVIQEKHRAFYEQAVEGLEDNLLSPVIGGATRQASVHAALKAIEDYRPQYVVLHDAARPFASPQLFKDVVQALKTAKGASCAVPVSDTLKRVENGTAVATLDREKLYAAQTPQAFDYSILRAAHEAAVIDNRNDFTDDAALLEWQGHEVKIVDGEINNFKLTTPQDWSRAETMLPQSKYRTAFGYDIHVFADGDHIMLGGVRIPYKQGVKAHSDGDVILHALTDALFGLTGQGDIGQHFPPNNPEWRNASSDLFVAHALKMLQRSGGCLKHCDITLLAESPKLAPHREAVINNISRLTGLPLNAIGLKATTLEGLGALGRREGLAAYVITTASFNP